MPKYNPELIGDLEWLGEFNGRSISAVVYRDGNIILLDLDYARDYEREYYAPGYGEDG